MKLELADFFEKVSLVNRSSVETATPKLLEMVKDYDEIIYTKSMEYYDVYDALIWLSRLKDYCGKRMMLSDETIQSILASLKDDRLKNDKWLVIAEWLIQLTQKP